MECLSNNHSVVFVQVSLPLKTNKVKPLKNKFAELSLIPISHSRISNFMQNIGGYLW